MNRPPHSIAALMASRLLEPLGNPPTNRIKFFCTADMLESIKNRTWLTEVTNAIIQRTKDHNDRKLVSPAKISRKPHPAGTLFSESTAQN